MAQKRHRTPSPTLCGRGLPSAGNFSAISAPLSDIGAQSAWAAQVWLHSAHSLRSCTSRTRRRVPAWAVAALEAQEQEHIGRALNMDDRQRNKASEPRYVTVSGCSPTDRPRRGKRWEQPEFAAREPARPFVHRLRQAERDDADRESKVPSRCPPPPPPTHR